MTKEIDDPGVTSLETEGSNTRASVPQSATGSPRQSTDAVNESRQPPSACLPAPGSWRSAPLPYLKSAAVVLIVVALTFVARPIACSQSTLDKGLRALGEAFRKRRPSEARFTHFNYAPHAETRGLDLDHEDAVARDQAGVLIQLAVDEHPGPASLQALGQLYAARQQFEVAIQQFENALKLDEENAQLHSDYGAALLEMGKTQSANGEGGRGLEEFARALDHFNRALEINENLAQARFNRALLFEYMVLTEHAENDWREYLGRDGSSMWATEARGHLDELNTKRGARSSGESELANRFLKAFDSRSDDLAYELISTNTEAVTRRLVWWQLLESFLKLSVAGQTEAAKRHLDALAYAGKVHEQRTGDRFIADLARIYEGSSAERLKRLSQANATINQAHLHLAKSEIDFAAELYEKAKRQFDNDADPLESHLADVWAGYCEYRRSKFDASLERLNRVSRYGSAKRYHWLNEQALTLIANIYLEADQFSKSIEYYEQSLGISAQINDAYNNQRNLSSLAHLYKNVGDRGRAFDYMLQCLRSAERRWPGERQMYRNYYSAAGVMISFKYYAAALEYEKAALQLALDIGDPIFQHQTYVHLAALSSKVQDHEGASGYLQSSLDAARAMDEQTRFRPLADSALQQSHAYRLSGDFDRAIAAYDEAINSYERMRLFAFIYEAHKGKLLCHLARDKEDLAGEELKTVLALFEEHRGKINEEHNRNSFFDLDQHVYDTAIDFEYSKRRDARRAFEYSEISRARSLLDLIKRSSATESIPQNGSGAQPLLLDAIRERMPGNAQLVQYSVLDDKVLIWVLSQSMFEVREHKITADTLSKMVLDFFRSTASFSGFDDEGTRRQATELYRVLISPIQGLLDRGQQICIVPDKVLNHLPFSALVSPEGQYLISDYLLSFAPSSNIFLACSEDARLRGGSINERVLSVGNPSFDRAAYPDLKPLPDSETEAEDVARCYQSHTSLVGKNASKSRVLQELGTANVIHLASHYVVDEQDPMRSTLLLADLNPLQTGGRGDGLQASDIYLRKLPMARIVVLSACRTGVEHYYKGEGMIGMSRTFLAARVPLVVASLWPVDSIATTELMVRFHRYRKAGGLTTVTALRKAQLDMINNSQSLYRRPGYWAPFIMIGGHADF